MAISRKPDFQAYRALSDVFRPYAELYGYEVIETDVVQDAEIFLTRAGDQIITRLFTFDHRGRNLALRPEFTAAAAFKYVRDYSNNMGANPVARWQFSGMVFEDDPLRNESLQRHSFGAELIGLTGQLAEAEVIALAANTLKRLQVPDLQVIIGQVALMRHILQTFSLDTRTTRFLLNHIQEFAPSGRGQAYVLKELDHLLLGKSDLSEEIASTASEVPLSLEVDINTQQMLNVLLDATQRGATMGGRSRHDIARRLIQKRQRAIERPQIIAAMNFLTSWSQISAPADVGLSQIRTHISESDSVAHHMVDQLETLIELLKVAGISSEVITLRPALARNWDYYTGMVFDLQSASSHIGGGGRYDELARLIGGHSDVPAVGFACYSDAVLSRTPMSSAVKRVPKMVTSSIEDTTIGFRWVSVLREHGIPAVMSHLENEGLMVVNPSGTLTFNQKEFTLDQLPILLDELGIS